MVLDTIVLTFVSLFVPQDTPTSRSHVPCGVLHVCPRRSFSRLIRLIRVLEQTTNDGSDFQSNILFLLLFIYENPHPTFAFPGKYEN